MLTGMPVVSRLCIDATKLAACYRLKCSGYRFGQRTSPTLKRFRILQELFQGALYATTEYGKGNGTPIN
jgi:hypothetical protein